MPPQNAPDTLTPASSESISAFMALDEEGRKSLLGKLTPAAKSALLMGLRTLHQAHQYGTETPVGRPGQRSRTPTVERGGPGGTLGPGAGDIASSFAYEGIPKAAKEVTPSGRVIGATALTALAPEAGIPASIGLATLGGAGGEAGQQLLERGVGSDTTPKTSGEAAKRIGKAGAEMGAFETGAQVVGKGVPYLYRAYLRHADPFNQGIDTLFRGLNPPKSMPGLRENLVEASDDLVNVFNKIDKRMASPEVKGGIINPDMRLRLFRNELDKYMQGMYHSERAAQIAAGAARGSRVTVGGNPAELEFIGRWLKRQLPIDSPALRAAESLAEAPLRPIPIQDADALAVAVNSFDMKNAWEGSASRTLSGKRALDQGLKQGLDNELHRIGQPGISDYERRYAALAQVRELLEGGMTDAEKRLFSQRLHSFLSLHGLNVRTHLGAFESPGSMLEEGLTSLRKAGRGGPSASTARPAPILQGEIVDPGEALAPPPRGFPQAGPPPGGVGGGTQSFAGRQLRGEPPVKGMLPPPKYEPPHPEYDVSPPGSAARKVIDDYEKAKDVASLRSVHEKAVKVGDTQDAKYSSQALQRLGAERRTAPQFQDIQGPDPTRIALMRDVQNKINGLPKGDPAREYLQDLLDDMKAHPFERAGSAGEEADIGKVRAKTQKKMTRAEAEAEHQKRHTDPRKIPPTSKLKAMGLPYEVENIEKVEGPRSRVPMSEDETIWRVHLKGKGYIDFYGSGSMTREQAINEAANIIGPIYRVKGAKRFEAEDLRQLKGGMKPPPKTDDVDF